MAPTLLIQLLVAALAPVLAEIEMEFTKYPESVTAPVGDEVTFECAVRVPGERLAWRWKPADRRDDRWETLPGVSEKEGIHTRLVVTVMSDSVTGLYQCVVWYGAISLASIPARLTVAKIDQRRSTGETRTITAPLHNTVVLHCKEPASDPPAVLTWWKEVKGAKNILETPHGVLVLHNVSLDDSGTYGCHATNELSGDVVKLPDKTHLKVQSEGSGGLRFLESPDYVGTVGKDNVLTALVRPDSNLRLWCGAVGTPPPRVTWWKDNKDLNRREQGLTITPFNSSDEGIYTCSANGNRRSWKVIQLSAPMWEGIASSMNASEGGKAKISCGKPGGYPVPRITWMLNAEPIEGAKAVGSDLIIDHVEKRHAGIVQCFACNVLGCAYDAALLTVVPTQISDQEYRNSPEIPRTMHAPRSPQTATKRHKKNGKKNKVMVPPSKPNVTRMSDESVMVSWSHPNLGLPIQFYKIQYKEATNASDATWLTTSNDIPNHIHCFLIDGLMPDRYYKFRIAAVYSNQDNKLGRSSAKFHLTRGGISPKAPQLKRATSTSPFNIHLEWTWSSDGGILTDGFYIYYRAVSSAGAYEKLTAPESARAIDLPILKPDTAYEVKVQAYTRQAPSEFSSILVAKTQRSSSAPSPTTEGPSEAGRERAPGALAAGGALGAAALLVILAVTLLLCRRAKRPPNNKEKGTVPETGGANGYIPAKVPITITANPMHAESGDGGVEMSFLHNNNTGNDDTLPHTRKNGSAGRQYV